MIALTNTLDIWGSMRMSRPSIREQFELFSREGTTTLRPIHAGMWRSSVMVRLALCFCVNVNIIRILCIWILNSVCALQWEVRLWNTVVVLYITQIIRTLHPLSHTQISCCIYQLFIRDDFTFLKFASIEPKHPWKKLCSPPESIQLLICDIPLTKTVHPNSS